MPMSRPLLSCVEINPVDEIKASVVWLHGLGADGHDFEPIVPQLRLPPELGVRFVFPHAPHRPVTINGGYVMRAWYDILTSDLSERVDEEGMRESARAVASLIEREKAAGLAPSRIILAGFSQGGVIALEVATRYPERLGGVIALSSYVPAPDRVPVAGQPLPVFMGHGTQDPIVPFSLGLRSRRLLESRGYAVEWHDYAMPHCVCAEEIGAIRTWLVGRLAQEVGARPAH
jgi:phospholipase/carboxylesterase